MILDGIFSFVSTVVKTVTDPSFLVTAGASAVVASIVGIPLIVPVAGVFLTFFSFKACEQCSRKASQVIGALNNLYNKYVTPRVLYFSSEVVDKSKSKVTVQGSNTTVELWLQLTSQNLMKYSDLKKEITNAVVSSASDVSVSIHSDLRDDDYIIPLGTLDMPSARFEIAVTVLSGATGIDVTFQKFALQGTVHIVEISFSNVNCTVCPSVNGLNELIDKTAEKQNMKSPRFLVVLKPENVVPTKGNKPYVEFPIKFTISRYVPDVASDKILIALTSPLLFSYFYRVCKEKKCDEVGNKTMCEAICSVYEKMNICQNASVILPDIFVQFLKQVGYYDRNILRIAETISNGMLFDQATVSLAELQYTQVKASLGKVTYKDRNGKIRTVNVANIREQIDAKDWAEVTINYPYSLSVSFSLPAGGGQNTGNASITIDPLGLFPPGVNVPMHAGYVVVKDAFNRTKIVFYEPCYYHTVYYDKKRNEIVVIGSDPENFKEFLERLFDEYFNKKTVHEVNCPAFRDLLNVAKNERLLGQQNGKWILKARITAYSPTV